MLIQFMKQQFQDLQQTQFLPLNLFMAYPQPAEPGKSDPNRDYTVPASNSVFQAWFDRDSIYTVTTDGIILFYVDMSVMSEVGIFVNTEDSVQVRGAFNGWNDSDPARSKMSSGLC